MLCGSTPTIMFEMSNSINNLSVSFLLTISLKQNVVVTAIDSAGTSISINEMVMTTCLNL